MDRRMIPYMLITIVLFTILAVAMTMHDAEQNDDKSYADELSEGWLDICLCSLRVYQQRLLC